MKNIKKSLINFSYFALIIVITSTVVSLSLARKFSHYATTASLYDFTVVKDEVLITNTIDGEVQKLNVSEGQEVKKSNVVAELYNPSLEERIQVLNQFGSNLSASTEVELLKTQKNAYQIRSTREGVVKEVFATRGSYVAANTPVLSLYANDSIVLEASMNATQLDEVQKLKSLSIYSSRLEQSFDIEYKGVESVGKNQQEFNTYIVAFAFRNEEDARLFFHGENLKVLGITNESYRTPIFRIVEFWEGILGKL